MFNKASEIDLNFVCFFFQEETRKENFWDKKGNAKNWIFDRMISCILYIGNDYLRVRESRHIWANDKSGSLKISKTPNHSSSMMHFSISKLQKCQARGAKLLGQINLRVENNILKKNQWVISNSKPTRLRKYLPSFLEIELCQTILKGGVINGIYFPSLASKNY